MSGGFLTGGVRGWKLPREEMGAQPLKVYFSSYNYMSYSKVNFKK
jgi:hypothetical protein